MTKPLISNIALTNFLSFGPNRTEVKLGPLNVLIGPNGSGKSNFLQSIRFLKCCVTGLDGFLNEDTSFREVAWHGEEEASEFILESGTHPNGRLAGKYPMHTHRIAVHEELFSNRFMVSSESIWAGYPTNREHSLYRYEGTDRRILANIRVERPDGRVEIKLRELEVKDIFLDSVLGHPDSTDNLRSLRESYQSVFFFDTIGYQHSSEARRAQRTDVDQRFLTPDGSNLANVVESLQHQPTVMAEIMSYLKRFYPKAVRLLPGLVGSRVRLFLEEEGLARTTPASRLSSGTIAFITLTVMLLHPSPPPVICLEQPEDGLHPDALPLIAEMLVKASKRTQVIVATHSEILVSALSDHPESILVFEPGIEGTTVRRLDAEELKPWLEKYSLGDLWVNGEIGGVRR